MDWCDWSAVRREAKNSIQSKERISAQRGRMKIDCEGSFSRHKPTRCTRAHNSRGTRTRSLRPGKGQAIPESGQRLLDVLAISLWIPDRISRGLQYMPSLCGVGDYHWATWPPGRLACCRRTWLPGSRLGHEAFIYSQAVGVSRARMVPDHRTILCALFLGASGPECSIVTARPSLLSDLCRTWGCTTRRG
jgi:hypothetical protein